MITLVVLLSAIGASGEGSESLYSPDATLESAVAGAVVVRAQGPSSDPFFGPGGTTTFYPPTYAPQGGTTTEAFQPYPGPTTPYAPYSPAPITSDPWLGLGGTPVPYASPYGNVPQGFYTFGLNGPRPYKFGFTERVNVGFMPSSGTSPNVGDLGIFETDVEKEFVTPLIYNWIFTAAGQFNYRAWDGPRGLPGPSHLPGSVYRFGLNLKIATPQVSGWHAEFGFNPALGTDFEKSLTSDAWMFDAHGVAFWQWGPQLTWALGAAYWDRVDDIVIPYAGVIWSPDDYWEFRLVFPNPRISYFIGTPLGVPAWVYVGAEYHVEAYEIALSPPGVQTRVQYEDWRIYGGLRFEAGQFVTFIEAGGTVAREVEYESPVGADFDVDGGFFGRLGVRF